MIDQEKIMGKLKDLLIEIKNIMKLMEKYSQYDSRLIFINSYLVNVFKKHIFNEKALKVKRLFITFYKQQSSLRSNENLQDKFFNVFLEILNDFLGSFKFLRNKKLA